MYVTLKYFVPDDISFILYTSPLRSLVFLLVWKVLFMPRRKKVYRSSDRYVERPRHRYREDEGCFSGIGRFFTNLFYGLVIGLISIVLVGFIVTHFQQTIAFFVSIFTFIAFLISILPQVLHYGFLLACVFAGLGILYGIVRLVSVISERLAVASAKRARAGMERARLRQEKVETEQRRVELQRRQVQLEQETYNYDERRRRGSMQEYQRVEEGRGYATRQLTQGVEPEQEQEEKPVIPGMPQLDVCYYRDYARYVRPGQLLIGIRKDGKPRVGTWADMKVVLVLGGSASGKTTTIAQQCLAIVRGGGMLAFCDPHAHKEDSLFKKVYPLRGAAFPGTVFAVEHVDILRNIQVIKAELDKRVQGADCSIPVCLVVEEMNRLQRDKAISNALTEVLQIIGQEGRGYNVFAVIGAQQISHFAGIRKSIISFVIHRVDESEAQLCIPARFAKYAPELRPGQTIIKDADGMTEPIIQTLTTAQDIQQEGARLAQPVAQPVVPRRTQAFYARETEQLDQRAQPPQSVDVEESVVSERRDYGRGTRAPLHRTHLQAPQASMQSQETLDEEETQFVREEVLPVIPGNTRRTTDKLDTSSRIALATWGETEKRQAVNSSSSQGTQFKRPLGTSRPPVQSMQQSQTLDVVKQSQCDLAVDKIAQLEELYTRKEKKRTTKKIN